MVKGSSNTSVRKNYLCIYHNKNTLNRRKLLKKVKRDPNDLKIIINFRKRENIEDNQLNYCDGVNLV
jgi:hypothetical protein